MSKFIPLTVECPGCGHRQEVTFFVSVNGQRVPHVEDEILEGRFHRFACEGCGRPSFVERPMAYTHLGRGQWLVMYPRDRQRDFRALEPATDEVFRREFLESAPAPVQERAARVRRRLVFGYRQLAERLRVFRQGWDDRMVECVKLWVLRDRIADLIGFGPVELSLDEVEDGGETMRFAVLDLERGQPLATLKAPTALLAELESERAALEASRPELFQALFVSANRYFL